MKKSSVISVGLDVHKETIAACWLRDDSQVEETRELANEPKGIAKLFRLLKSQGEVRACYEAGVCGFEVRRQLESLGVSCDVIAPSLIPVRAGDRVKTDRRDARKLARLFRAGELTAIQVPTKDEEALLEEHNGTHRTNSVLRDKLMDLIDLDSKDARGSD